MARIWCSYLHLLVVILSTMCAVSSAVVQETTVPPTMSSGMSTKQQDQYNCLQAWLEVAGASQDYASQLVASRHVTRFGLDEKKIKSSDTYFISVILDFDGDLAEKLKQCVDRNATCPASSTPSVLPCSARGVCLHNATSETPRCQCPLGLVGERCETDIDECAVPQLNECDDAERARCHDTHGSYVCECLHGYYGDGRRCEDVDECQAGVHRCHQHAHCNNTLGQYTCKCSHGYLGNGRSCEADPCSGESNSGLCRRVLQAEKHNKRLEQKLKLRDGQINTFRKQIEKITEIFREHHDSVDRAMLSMNSRLEHVETRNETNLTCTRPTLGYKYQSRRSGASGKQNGQIASMSFRKKHTDTVLRLSYSGTIRSYHGGRSVYWLFKIDNKQCTRPTHIDIVMYQASQADNHIPSVLTGVCESVESNGAALSAGNHTISVHISDGRGSSHSGYRSTSIMEVQEVCRPN
ncbi:uncharacterized protein LOC135824794 [Sycon ciliatum]|uniref:uncharacterized protein LOC135824794 n=1 Tax=Sycon ciliatum TaxID=27933 RepID=UPI0031F6079D